MIVIKEKLNKIRLKLLGNKLTDTLSYILLYALILTLLGRFIPEIYYATAEAEAFYKITSPITFEKEEFKPCEEQVAFYHRWSIVDADAISNLELFLFDSQGRQVKKASYSKPITISKTGADGENRITTFLLPCDIPDGQYHWEGVNHFEVKGHTKHENWYSVSFSVKST